MPQAVGYGILAAGVFLAMLLPAYGQQTMAPAPQAAVVHIGLPQPIDEPSSSPIDLQDALGGLGPVAPIRPREGQLPGAGHGPDEPLGRPTIRGVDPHAEVFAESQYPSAVTCAKCHRRIYDQWRVSAHAYAAVSPMFQCFEQKMTELTRGTVGTFCVRCHAPIAMQLNYPRSASMIDAPAPVREGITCVACHRVKYPFGKVNGERRIEPGPITDPVYGGIGGEGVAAAIANKDPLKIKTDVNDKRPGQTIHLQGIRFEQLSHSEYCAPCHQVAVHPGIALEVVWAQYRAGPAAKKGIQCQDCHMGLVPGKPLGYAYGPVAEVNGQVVHPMRKQSNHLFYGPGNSIAHPGIFPHNENAFRWSAAAWLHFDWKSGWGTEAFEQAVAAGQLHVDFPPPWDSVDERRAARRIIDENLQLLDLKKASAIAVMEAGSHIDGPFFEAPPRRGQPLSFYYEVRNISEGHNNPSGSLGAQPQLWLNVALTGPDGRHLWESGYLDRHGDLANQHSLDVTSGRIPSDRQLFNLQTQFLITGVKGTDREMYLPINVDVDPLPFLRPGNIPVSVLNHPPLIRMEQKSLPPLSSKKARYTVPGELLQMPGTYRLSVRLRSRMEPIYFMRFCGATPEMQRRMIEQTIDIHPQAVQFVVP
ncbi:MAG: cytochrome c [Pirellulaceae bacterium]|nr:MAG: cytochrome c [Pirellulaceae bacterium]